MARICYTGRRALVRTDEIFDFSEGGDHAK